MTWVVPDWWTVALLALAAYRAWRLLGEDVIFDRPRDWVTARLGEKSEAFITCPYCSGAWLTIIAWLAWSWQPHWTLVAATPFAISALVGMVAANLDPD